MLRNKFLPFRKMSDRGSGVVDIGFVVVIVVVTVVAVVVVVVIVVAV